MVEQRREQAAEAPDVKPHLEQAAEVLKQHWEQAAGVVPIPLLWRGARQGGVVELRLEQTAEMVERRLPAPCGRADKAGKDQALPGPLPRGIDSGVIGVIQLQHAQGVGREIIKRQHARR